MLSKLIPYTLLIKVLLIASLLTGAYFYVKSDLKVRAELSATTINLKSTQAGLKLTQDKEGQWHALVIQQEQTLSQFKASTDSIQQSLLTDIKKYKISLNKVDQVGQIRTKLIRDTAIVYKPGKDTTYDLSDRPDLVHTITLKANTLKDSLAIYNTQDLVFHDKRETINPPRKFFLWRLFQKKQTVVDAEVVNSNKHIITTNQEFIHIIK